MALFLCTLEGASKNLRVSVFLIDSSKFEAAVFQAAQRGCQVRVMVNGANPGGMHQAVRVPASWATHRNIEVKEIGEIAADDSVSTPILHAKLVVADAQDFDDASCRHQEAAIEARGRFAMGSPNPTRAGSGYNIECSMRTVGDSVEAATLAWQFDSYWRAATAEF